MYIVFVFFKLFPSPSLCKYGIKFRRPWSINDVLVSDVFGECSLIVICSNEVFWCFFFFFFFFNLEICIGQ